MGDDSAGRELVALARAEGIGLDGVAVLDVIVVTLGAEGAVAVTADRVDAVDGRRVDVVDTTGAGDGFVGALAAGLAGGRRLGPALAYANAAASLVVQRPGAAPSMPFGPEIEGAAVRPISGS